MPTDNQQPTILPPLVGTPLGKAAFSVSSRVALQLGRESISSCITAIVELVKNAYDADADKVRIRFANLGTTAAFMVIEDTGEGMSVDDLRGFWMVIGTGNKTYRKKTAKKRTVTGEKGLGRLGLDRLCAQTEVESIVFGAKEGFRLDVRWGRYEDSEQRLETVEHDLYSIPNLQRDPISNQWRDYPKGTRLILRGLKDVWDQDSIGQLRADLALLVSPFQAPNDFSIEIETGQNWETLDGPVSVPAVLLEAANWKLVATIDEVDQVEIRMTSQRHETEYHLKSVPWSEAIKKMGIKPHCGPVRMEFYFFVRKDAELAARTLKAKEVTDFLKFNQGIRIYRDGFRVKPYGEPDGTGDWLRLAYRRTQNPEGVAQDAKPGNWRVGYNQVVGAVFISHDKNPGLDDQTNREGLLQGKALDHLRAFAMRAVQFLEIHQQTFEMGRKAIRNTAEQAEDKAKESIAGAGEALQKLEALAGQITNLLNPIEGNHASGELQAGIGKVLIEAKRELDLARTGLEQTTKLYQQAEEQKNTMANLASLGILSAAFGHETLNWIGTVAKNARWLLKNFSDGTLMVLPKLQQEITTALIDTEGEAEKVRKFARFTLGNLNREKRQLRAFCLKETIARVFNAFDETLRFQRKIAYDFGEMPSAQCPINGYEMDWESIVVNLITNATWALEDKPADERQIKVSLRDHAEEWEMEFADSGIGLEAGTAEFIFRPGFTTKRNSHGEHVGTGMGLFIVRSFVEEHTKGQITANAHGPLGGASFSIHLPKISPP
jgi:signal transduction histidine kinase